ncbi:hypothetical protein [Chryseobacterium rhizosphaerae]|uniref:Uncharacterized protein n=1 Tax=Chryseobacterium rhizosphaerae TaxID=395937 RepID=A0ABX9IFS1_9FLAO|nr:hypothetical protein [Chryseobacterium rhizosphaerae]REC70971.1 hypothetical protein DRF57_21495 [Chryseobacterium rhizosphaerae]GEN69855.1 hypothetical protein CRH01_44230 [Chryseobacterium rhizosphaerae]
MNEFAHIELDEKRLADQTLQYILKNQNTGLRSSLFLEILDPRIKYGDLNDHIELLKERLSHLKFFIDYNTVEFKNTLTGFSDHTHQTITLLGRKMSEKENFSKEIFWASPKEEEAYHKISQFNSFEDKIVDEKKLYNVLINGPFFNVKGWILYYQALLDLKFAEFSEKIVSGKTIIKYRPFKGKYFIGIETDYQSCKINFRKGWWEEPGYKLIIFEKLEAKKITKVVIFERFVHPHFDPPAFSFLWFFGSKTRYDVSDIETVTDDGTRKEFLEDGTVRLYNTNKFEDDYKRHAYYYYDMLYQTTKEYIRFIEESFDPEE